MATPSRPSSDSSKASSSKTVHNYQLGDPIGKGSFGQVYRALNWATGETVAVKEIQLGNVPKAELGEIMSEIDLLKNLNHPNIVQYKGFVKTREYLYIILEYCENGSLHNIVKRIGKFSESLVAAYISQVLEGLVYLHDQGVIHRKIKGANILANKNGIVKLASFGVASKAVAGVHDAVVGSPYWMAPEVIEQIGATTASDIWSVGCVVIELLEGHPPFHNLEPMPALFHIVQDDCPPIPEGASPIVKDFLYHCFQKDYNLRVSAKKLLRHPWMVSARKQLAEGKVREGSNSGAVTPESNLMPNYNYDEAVLKVQEWNEALKSPTRLPKHPSRNLQPHSPLLAHTTLPPTSIPISMSHQGGWKAGPTPNAPENLVEKIHPMSFVLQPPEEQADNWDDDFEEGISFSKLQALDRTSVEEDKHEIEDNAQTIRANRSPSQQTVPLAQPPSSDIGPILEDYSDIVEGDGLEHKVADSKPKKQMTKEEKLRSVAVYPSTVAEEDMADAIPSWTQPKLKEGNWDEIGLDDQYELADRSPQPRKVEKMIEPALNSSQSSGYHVSKTAEIRRHLELMTKLLIGYAAKLTKQPDFHGIDHFDSEFGKLINGNPQAIELDIKDWEKIFTPC